jgi:ATP-binding cassette subfamily F protein uup
VLLVSHDRVFLDRVVTSTLAFEGDGRVTEYVGGYEDYLRQRGGRRTEDGGRDGGREQAAKAEAVTLKRERPRRLSYKEQRELDALPETIAALEDEQARLKAEVASAEFYKSPADHIHAVLARIDAVHVELDAALARWVELEAIADAGAGG